MLRIIFFCLFFSVSICAAAEVPFAVTDTDGHTVSGTIIALDSVQFVLDSDGTKTEIATEKIVRLQNLMDNPFQSAVSISGESSAHSSLPNISLPQKSSKSIAALLQKQEPNSSQKEKEEQETKPIFPESVSVLELKDRTRLVVTEFVTKGKSVVVRLLNNKEITLPLEQLLMVRLMVKSLNDVTVAPEEWRKFVVQSAETGDRIVVGQLGSLDVYTGILAEVGKDTISFIVDGETLPVPRRKVFGLLFHSPQRSQNVADDVTKDTAKTSLPLFGFLSLWNGTKLPLHSLTLDENDQWNWTTISGVSGTLLPEEIDALDIGRKNMFYLTDLKPTSLEQSFFFDRETVKADDHVLRMLRTYRTQKIISQLSSIENDNNNINSNSKQSPILLSLPRTDSRQNKIPDLPIPGLKGFALDGNFYERGFAIPAKTVLEYTLTDSFTAFRAVTGIDDRLRPNGGVRLRVLAEQQLLGEWEFYGDEPAKLLKLPLPPNTKILKFEIDFLKEITAPAILTLAEPQLMK
ncbi:MAG: NPCBM/NEW2 domain-containing protein [Planctomycetaceae bacterium]|jgi:K+/H+ antiporter YhaU regulatory subunit KhtT|nr:NPCBM/NEW2 domain-containing protein [Planctomycetaceae bacterium]